MIGRVYAIVHRQQPDHILYIGSTTCEVSDRWRVHRHTIKKKTHGKLFKHMSTRGGIDNFTYVVLEDMVYQDKKSMLKREQYFFTLHNPQLNTKKCSIGDRTKKEYHQLYYKENSARIIAQKVK